MDSFSVNVISDDLVSTAVQLPGASSLSSVEYPSEWFKTNSGQKLPVYIPKEVEDKVTWGKYLGSALHGTMSPQVALRFMYEYIKSTFKETLTSDWRSYDRLIGSKDEEITPLCSLDVIILDKSWTGTEGVPLDAKEQLRLFSILLTGYRYGLASEIVQGDYKSNVLSKINMVLRNEPFDIGSDLTPTELSRCKLWYNNLEFKVLIAALDMFWSKFPESEWAKFRVCTLNSRFKDCTSISELRHLTELTGMKLHQSLEYIFCARIRDEVMAMAKGSEELSKDDSYFPYMREFRLSKKSPYSSSSNVHLHNWISIFGALLGSERSFNARIVSESGLVTTMGLAAFAASAFKRYVRPQVVFGSETVAAEARTIEKSGDDDSQVDFAIQDSSPMGVFKLMSLNNNKVPPEMMKEFAAKINSITSVREKSIGKFLKFNLT